MSLSRVRALDKNATKIRKTVADTIVNQTNFRKKKPELLRNKVTSRNVEIEAIELDISKVVEKWIM